MEPGSLAQGHQLGMAERIGMLLTAVAAPADAAPAAIQHDRRDWNLPAAAGPGCAPQQAGHPRFEYGGADPGQFHDAVVAERDR